jgi:membrane-bound lytic murein transglycosylase A
MTARRFRLGLLLACSSFIGMAGFGFAQTAEPIKFPGAQYVPLQWGELHDWAADDHAAAFAAFLSSCTAIASQRGPTRLMVQIGDALQQVCDRAKAALPLDEAGARKFFEANFRPVQISKLGETDGFLTGYYEPIIDGSRVPTAQFTAPLYQRPPNLVASGSRKLGGAFPSKGIKVGRRFGRRKIVPYYTRGEIEDGRSTAGTSKSAGCAASLMSCMPKFRVRPASGLKTAPSCG